MDSKKTLIKKDNFNTLTENLLGIGSTYSSILILNNKNIVTSSYSSNPDWSNEFTSTGLYKDCHLLQEAHNQMKIAGSSNFTLLWDLYSPLSEGAKELDEIRKSKNISHGVGFCLNGCLGEKILLNVAGKFSDINFGMTVLRYRKKIYGELLDFTLKSISAHS